MSTLLCFGLGYSAERFVAAYGDGYERIIGTVRGAERAAVLNAHLSGRLKALVFDGRSPTPELRHAVGEAEAALISIPQDEHGDPVLRTFAGEFAHARRLGALVYLSTVGVYGDHGGAWVQGGSARHHLFRFLRPAASCRGDCGARGAGYIG